MTAFIYYHKQFSLSTIFQSFQRNFFKFFSKLFSSQNVVFAFGLHHNPKLAYCLRQLAYNNPLKIFCKAFYADFCKFFKFFFIRRVIGQYVLKIHYLDEMFERSTSFYDIGKNSTRIFDGILRNFVITSYEFWKTT